MVEFDISLPVEVDDVRTALSEIEDEKIPTTTIQQSLVQARSYIDGELDDDDEYTDEMIYFAVVYETAYDSFLSSPPKVQEGALDLNKSWSVARFLDYLNEKRKQWLIELGILEGGSSAAFATSTDGAFAEERSSPRWY